MIYFLNKKKGFSLPEILISLAIIGIIVLIGMPAISNYQHSLETTGTVRNLISDLRYAQQLAVTEQIEHGVYFITGENKYQVRRYGSSTTTLKEVVFPAEITEVTISGLTAAEAGQEARYNPYGAVRNAGSIILKNSQNATTSVDVRPSGFVKISD